MNILVTGANGQLGSEIRLLAVNSEWNFLFTDIEELDIIDKRSIKVYFKDHSINICINCAAYTKVDNAESEQDLAKQINEIATRNLAEVCNSMNAIFLHISTDFVFDGKNSKPYKEEDMTLPVSVYGQTKLAGEIAATNACENTIIIRTSWLYSTYGKNFVHTMLHVGKEKKKLNVVSDQIGTPTYAADLAVVIFEILLLLAKSPESINKLNGIYHYSNEGIASWYDFAVEIFKIAGMKVELTPITSAEYPLPAQRPSYSVIDKEKIKHTFGLKIPHWKTSLEICMKKLKFDS